MRRIIWNHAFDQQQDAVEHLFQQQGAVKKPGGLFQGLSQNTLIGLLLFQAFSFRYIAPMRDESVAQSDNTNIKDPRQTLGTAIFILVMNALSGIRFARFDDLDVLV